MDVLKLIERDHDEAMELIERLEDMADQPTTEADKLSLELAISMLLHSRSEEEALYTKCTEQGEEHEDLKDFALQSYIEHQLLEITIQKFLSVRPGGNGQFKAYLSVMKDLIEHHGREEEEQEMFPKLRNIFSDEERTEMGERMMEAKEEMRPQIEKNLMLLMPTQGKATKPAAKPAEKPAMKAASKVEPKTAKPSPKTAPAKKMTMKSKTPPAKSPVKAAPKPMKKAPMKGKKKSAARPNKNLAQ